MLFRTPTLEAIRRGSVTLAFRRWKRPTVRAGGTLLTAIGQLSIHAVDAVELDDVTESDARDAGFADLESLRAELLDPPDRQLYRVRVSLAGPDPRNALRERVPGPADMASVLDRLGRLDQRSLGGDWTEGVLTVIDAHPGVRAADLAATLGLDTAPFKANVRKLKALGLTESLEVGYRLSRRGRVVLARLRGEAG